MEGWKLLTRLGQKGPTERGGEREVWRLLTRLWSEETKSNKGGRKEGNKKGGGVETPDASLVRGNQKKKERGRGRQERREERRGGRLSSLTRLWSDNPNQIGARVWDVDTEWSILI